MLSVRVSSLYPARTILAPARTRLVLGPSERGPWVHLVDEGLVRPVAITPDGREFGLGLLGTGEAFLQPEASEAEAPPRIGFYVEAIADSRCVSLPREELPGLAARDPALAGRLLAALAGRVADLSDLSASLCLDSAGERLLRLLRRLADRHGVPDAGSIRLRLRQQDLAAMAGVCRETVNAALRELADQGHIRVGRQTVWMRAGGLAIRA